MNGILILTEARSGSNWLGSLLETTGVMGVPSEWLDLSLLGSRPASAEAYVDAIISKASTPNGRFVVKLFPRHLHFAQMEYGVDFVQECRRRFAVGLVRLGRANRQLQAISYARGMMTEQWTSRCEPRAAPVYDFKAITQAYFYIERSEAFWNAYLALNRLEAPHFIYEEMVPDPWPFVEACAGILDVAFDGALCSDLKRQRDGLTEEWLARFREDLLTGSVLPFAMGRPASRTVPNLGRFFNRQPMTPL